MIDYHQLGRMIFDHHRRCALLNAHAPAETLDGWDAIRFHFPPEDQGDMLIQVSRPHAAWRVAWVQGWEQRRNEYNVRSGGEREHSRSDSEDEKAPAGAGYDLSGKEVMAAAAGVSASEVSDFDSSD